MKEKPKYTVLRQQANWKNLRFYKKSEVLYQLTYAFTRRFLAAYGDRTVDQMVQAARCCKQNIVEGSADGVTSTESELKLLNIARGSLQELMEDYVDYLASRQLAQWGTSHPRYDAMLHFCRENNDSSAYTPYLERWNDEEMANAAITLCRMTDRMLTSYIEKKDREFVSQGGIRERMTAARLGYRTDQRNELDALRKENQILKERIKQLEEIISRNSR